jgi:polyphosphate kinase
MKYLLRDISWLSFNERVLDETNRKDLPLGEKVLFLGITNSNLDEFMQVRYPACVNSLSNKELTNVSTAIKNHIAKVNKTYQKFIQSRKLIRRINELNDKNKKQVVKFFKNNIYPTLNVMTITKQKTLSLHSGMYLLVITEDKDENDKINYIEIPKTLDRFIQVKNEKFCIKIEDLIKHNLKYIFHNRKIKNSCTFTITRSAEVYIQYNDYMDPIELVSKTLFERQNSWITRVEVDTSNKSLLKHLKEFLPITPNTLLISEGTVQLSDLKHIPSSIYSDANKIRKFEPYNTIPKGNIFDYIKEEDRLVFHPYESFQSSVVRFLNDASTDPDVVSIKITLYRVSDNSEIISALLKAADTGKLVTVMVELKARFDEHHNVQISRILTEGGVRIVYTKPNVKTHAKVCLVTRKEKNGKLRIYSHVGTGNYSESNAKQYSDYSYFTAKQDTGYDLSRFFNLMCSDQEPFKSNHITYAPYNMRDVIMNQIDKEIKKAKNKKNGYIVCKCNSFTDDKIANKIVEASKAGVKVDLIIRGACILEPMKNIKIYSIVGRFLEHSRVYVFSSGRNARVFIGSSDIMYRNLNLRNELLIRVENKEIKARIQNHIKWYLADTVNRRKILKGYKYENVLPKGNKPFSSQEAMIKEAKKLAH